MSGRASRIAYERVVGLAAHQQECLDGRTPYGSITDKKVFLLSLEIHRARSVWRPGSLLYYVKGSLNSGK
jgi:hypothetical protein